MVDWRANVAIAIKVLPSRILERALGLLDQMAVVICFERPLYRDRWVCRRVVLVWSSLQSDVIIAVKTLTCRFLQRTDPGLGPRMRTPLRPRRRLVAVSSSEISTTGTAPA